MIVLPKMYSPKKGYRIVSRGRICRGDYVKNTCVLRPHWERAAGLIGTSFTSSPHTELKGFSWIVCRESKIKKILSRPTTFGALRIGDVFSLSPETTFLNIKIKPSIFIEDSGKKFEPFNVIVLDGGGVRTFHPKVLVYKRTFSPVEN